MDEVDHWLVGALHPANGIPEGLPAAEHAEAPKSESANVELHLKAAHPLEALGSSAGSGEGDEAEGEERKPTKGMPAAAAGATKSLADKLPSNPRMPAPLQPKEASEDDAAAES